LVHCQATDTNNFILRERYFCSDDTKLSVTTNYGCYSLKGNNRIFMFAPCINNINTLFYYSNWCTQL